MVAKWDDIELPEKPAADPLDGKMAEENDQCCPKPD